MESVSIVIPPAGSSPGSWKLLIVTPGSPLKALKDMFFVSETLSKIVPKATSCNEGDDIVQVKLGLCSKNVANVVNLCNVGINPPDHLSRSQNSLVQISNREGSTSLIVWHSGVRSSTDWRKSYGCNLIAFPGDDDRFSECNQCI